MALTLLSIGVVAIVMGIMAVGVIFQNRCLRGSCGGPEIFDSEGESLNCAACPRRAEREARAANDRAKETVAA